MHSHQPRDAGIGWDDRLAAFADGPLQDVERFLERLWRSCWRSPVLAGTLVTLAGVILGSLTALAVL
jgi:hypothetical protein